MAKQKGRREIDPQEMEQHMGIVRKVLRQRVGKTTYEKWARDQGLTEEELESCGKAALWKALSKFDAASHGNLEAYATTVIGNDLKKFIKKNGRSKPPPLDKDKRKRLSEAMHGLAGEGHLDPTDEQLAAWSGVNIDDVKEWRQHMKHQRQVSINSPLSGNRPEEGRLIDLLEDEAESPEVEPVNFDAVLVRFDAVLAKAQLTAEEESVIRLRWGMDHGEDRVLKMRPRPRALVAEILAARKRGPRSRKYNTEHIRLLEKQATGKLAKLLSK